MSDSTPNRTDGLFVTTLWTVVSKAGSAQTAEARPALERLCETYWYPTYAYVRRRGYGAEDAQDLTQGFFTRLITHNPFQALAPEKGRFRSFLLAALGHYLADERDRRHAAKRGGGQKIFSLDETVAEQRYAIEPVSNETPEKEFDRRWALAVLERALEILGAEQMIAGKQRVFELLRPFLVDGTDKCDYSIIAEELRISSNSVAVTVRRLRQRYRELVRSEIGETLSHPADVDTEMRHLLEAMREVCR